MFSSLVPLVLAASVVVPSLTAPTPVLAPTPEPPKLTAERWIVYDADADVVLASWNANDPASMASVTKVMTSIVALENVDLSDVVTVPTFVTGIHGSVAGLVPGEKWTVGDLLIAMLVRSGNDAAYTLGNYVGGGSTEAFVGLMNAKARELGMTNTHFANPAGLDAEDHYSSARDLLTLLIESQKYPDIVRIGRIQTVSMQPDPNGDPRVFNNTNKLLGRFPGTVGLKTGDTPWADKVLLGVTERAGRTIYSVVMHSDDHFADTRELVEWAFQTYSVQDRLLRPLYTEAGGGAITSPDLDLTEGHERRLRALPALDDGRWNTSSLEDLPKAAAVGRWIREAIPDVAGGSRD